MRVSRFIQCGLLLASAWSAKGLPVLAAAPEVGELARLTRRETLLQNGKTFAQASKGQEFTVLKREPGNATVSYMKEDGSWVAVTVPADALEAVTPPPWDDLLRGVRAFRDQRYDAARVQDKDQAALAGALSQRIQGALNAAAQSRNPSPTARQALVTTITALRDAAEQLAKAGRISLAAAMDEGATKLAMPILGAETPASRVNAADLSLRATTAERAFIRARQAIGAHRLIEARKLVEEGLEAEAAHPGLVAFKPVVKKGIEEAEELFETANKMRRFEKGAIHALSAIDDGLKICSDHPRLRTLRTEMNAQFEERTSPQVTAAFLSTAKVTTGKETLEEGRKLYTARCTECHDLEMLENRSLSSWDRTVSGMARRAGLSGTEKNQIMEYIAAALKVVEAGQ
jgi:hypothetical protein